MNILDTIGTLFTDPYALFKETTGQKNLGQDIGLICILIAIYSLLSAVVATLTQIPQLLVLASTIFDPSISIGIGIAVIPIVTIFTIVVSFIVFLVSGALFFIWLYIWGGRQPLSVFIRMYIYVSIPLFLFGWIPYIGILASFYTIILLILAINDIYEFSVVKSILVVLLPIVLIVVGIVILFIAIMGLAFLLFFFA